MRFEPVTVFEPVRAQRYGHVGASSDMHAAMLVLNRPKCDVS